MLLGSRGQGLSLSEYILGANLHPYSVLGGPKAVAADLNVSAVGWAEEATMTMHPQPPHTPEYTALMADLGSRFDLAIVCGWDTGCE